MFRFFVSLLWPSFRHKLACLQACVYVCVCATKRSINLYIQSVNDLEWNVKKEATIMAHQTGEKNHFPFCYDIHLWQQIKSFFSCIFEMHTFLKQNVHQIFIHPSIHSAIQSFMCDVIIISTNTARQWSSRHSHSPRWEMQLIPFYLMNNFSLHLN